jgi:hypothetical protein
VTKREMVFVRWVRDKWPKEWYDDAYAPHREHTLALIHILSLLLTGKSAQALDKEDMNES